MASLKRSSSSSSNSNNEEPPSKRVQIRPHEPPKQYVYMVFQDWQADSHAKVETKCKGAYSSLLDANNRVLQLWNHLENREAGPEERKQSAIEGEFADGKLVSYNCYSPYNHVLAIAPNLQGPALTNAEGTLWWRDTSNQFEGEIEYVRIEKHEAVKDSKDRVNTWVDTEPSQCSTSGHPYSYYE